MEQVNELIAHRFNGIINHELGLTDGSIITVTQVKTSRDLSHAQIGISIYPEAQCDLLFSKMCKNLKHLSHLLHKELSFKKSPRITVYLDHSTQKMIAFHSLLDSLPKEDAM